MSIENCGPFLYFRPSSMYELQIKEEADSKIYEVPGPRGTPLQLAWRLFHSPRKLTDHREKFQKVMMLLMRCGANTDWTEPDGTIVDKTTIRAWCAMSQQQIWLQSEFDYAFCEAGWYTYEYPLYASQSEIEIYKNSTSLGQRMQRPANAPDGPPPNPGRLVRTV